jgi:hypothetical protein
MSEDTSSTNIIAFRLNALEEMMAKTHEDLLAKLDIIIEKQQLRDTAIALEKQKREQMQTELSKLEKRTFVVESTLTKLQISMAEKLGPGALAGAAVAFAVEVTRFLIMGE